MKLLVAISSRDGEPLSFEVSEEMRLDTFLSLIDKDDVSHDIHSMRFRIAAEWMDLAVAEGKHGKGVSLQDLHLKEGDTVEVDGSSMSSERVSPPARPLVMINGVQKKGRAPPLSPGRIRTLIRDSNQFKQAPKKGAPLLSSDRLTNLVRSMRWPRKSNMLAEAELHKNSLKTYRDFSNAAARARWQHIHAPLVDVYRTHPGDYGAFDLVFAGWFREMVRRERVMRKGAGTTEGQKLIEERIRKEQLEKNLSRAMTHLPEAFTRVEMLYIRAHINAQPLNVFVDTGAQMTILSESAARKCNLVHLIDTRIKMNAAGIGGKAEALGTILACDMSLSGHSLLVSCAVLPDAAVGQDMILGLDTLLRHRCLIDLGKRTLTWAGDVTVPFLTDAEAAKMSIFGMKSDESEEKSKIANKTK